MAMVAAERIIWSADVETPAQMIETANTMSGLTTLKVDRLFTDLHGRRIIDDLRSQGFRVFYDAKFIEIPSKLEGLAKEAVKYEPWMVNCMAGAISNGLMSLREDRDLMDGLRRFAAVCLSADTKPCGVTVLTSKTAGVVAEEFNRRTAVEQVLYYVEMLVQAEFTDVVCSPHEVADIRKTFGSEIDLNTPGVRFADSTAGDQARVATPGDAIASGVNRVIMGRPLTNGNPADNFARAVTEIDAALAAA